MAGVVIPVLWFGVVFKGAAVAALQARQQYLTTLATERYTPGVALPAPRPSAPILLATADEVFE
jgi:hypothetical protein